MAQLKITFVKCLLDSTLLKGNSRTDTRTCLILKSELLTQAGQRLSDLGQSAPDPNLPLPITLSLLGKQAFLLTWGPLFAPLHPWTGDCNAE